MSERASRGALIELPVRTSGRVQLLDITDAISRAVAGSGVKSGICHIYVPHTTAGVIVNENADPTVARDIAATLDRLVPRDGDYRHLEGNADAHIKSALVGVSETVFIEGGRLALGRWQGIFFCEFDGSRERRIRLKIVPDPAE
jgi:secondary thiamine-phosphate synthase enzyme